MAQLVQLVQGGPSPTFQQGLALPCTGGGARGSWAPLIALWAKPTLWHREGGGPC